MSTNTQPSVREQARAVFLALIMVTSIVAMSVSFSATVAAEEEPEPEIEFEETFDEIGIESPEYITYDELGDRLIVLGENDDSEPEIWVVNPDDQSVEWSTELTTGFNNNFAFTDEYIFVADEAELEAIDRDSEEAIAETDVSIEDFEAINEIEAGTDYLYVAADVTDGDYGVQVFDVDDDAGEFDRVGGALEDEVIYGVAVDDDELATVSHGTDRVDIYEIEDDPVDVGGEPLVTHDLSDEYDADGIEPLALEYDNDEVFVAEHEDGGSHDYIRKLSVDTTEEDTDEEWWVDMGEWDDSNIITNDISIDNSWVYVENDNNIEGVALDRDTGQTTWSIDEDVDFDLGGMDVVTAGGDFIDMFAFVVDGDTREDTLLGITDGIIESDSTAGTITTTVDAPHPDVAGIELTSTNPGTDITVSGVGQPDATYELSIELDGDLENVDWVETELFRVDEDGERIAEDPTEDEYYELTIEFDEEGEATVSSEEDSDTHLSATAIEGIDREAETDTTVVEIDLPENVRPSANTQDGTVNDYSWEVTSTPINEDIEEETDPETLVDNFEIGVLVDATINTGEVEVEEDLVLPGDENVAHAPTGADDALEVEAGGNVEFGVDMSASDLDHETEDDTISADQTKVLAGDGHTLSDYDHEDVTELANNPVDIGASELTHGEQEEIRMWIDYPNEIEPGEYNGEFTVTVNEVGAS